MTVCVDEVDTATYCAELGWRVCEERLEADQLLMLIEAEAGNEALIVIAKQSLVDG